MSTTDYDSFTRSWFALIVQLATSLLLLGLLAYLWWGRPDCWPGGR